MPIYEYRCKSCGHTFERMQRLSDPIPGCPDCGEAVEKLISAPAFQFKGSGWYVTDYAAKGRNGQGKGEDGGKADAAAGEKADSGKAEGKKESASSDGGTKSDAKPGGDSGKKPSKE